MASWTSTNWPGIIPWMNMQVRETSWRLSPASISACALDCFGRRPANNGAIISGPGNSPSPRWNMAPSSPWVSRSSPVTFKWMGNVVVPPRDGGDCSRHPFASMVIFTLAIASPVEAAVTVHHQENSATDSNFSKSKAATSASSLRPRINSRSE